nr:MAG TPA: hypothetical protein [Caudoviricetes sp.]
MCRLRHFYLITNSIYCQHKFVLKDTFFFLRVLTLHKRHIYDIMPL